ncbi:MAG TPA: potassium-transporting ATPase subunit C [Verrucomicrobiae bacterium]|nr:potassium-transporting ATPase subunit C [Verrucomicrobiae bacterium]
MLAHLRRSVLLAVLFAAVCGLLYPLAVTGVATWLFPAQARGSIGPDGASLIGQAWTGPRWFHGRPDPDNPIASGATNLGPLSRALAADVAANLRAWHRLGVQHPTADLLVGSGSGLDPDISPRSAYVQVEMVARARHLSVARVRRLVRSQVQPPEWGFLGAPVVNVLQLNQRLARLG